MNWLKTLWEGLLVQLEKHMEVVSLFSDSMKQYKRLALKIISLWNKSLCQTYQSHIYHY